MSGEGVADALPDAVEAAQDTVAGSFPHYYPLLGSSSLHSTTETEASVSTQQRKAFRTSNWNWKSSLKPPEVINPTTNNQSCHTIETLPRNSWEAWKQRDYFYFKKERKIANSCKNKISTKILEIRKTQQQETSKAYRNLWEGKLPKAKEWWRGVAPIYTDLTRETNKDTSLESKKKKHGLWHQWLLAPKSVETKAGKDEEWRGRAPQLVLGSSKHEISMGLGCD